MAQLVWDLGEWLWPLGQRGEDSPSFFEYRARIGRRLMLRLQPVPHYPRRLPHWLDERISHVVQGQFWSTIWSLRVSWRVSYFMWMLAHASLLVGDWAACAGHDQGFLRCPMRV